MLLIDKKLNCKLYQIILSATFSHYEKCAVDFLSKYDDGDLHMYKADALKLQIMNDNFTVREISDVIELI